MFCYLILDIPVQLFDMILNTSTFGILKLIHQYFYDYVLIIGLSLGIDYNVTTNVFFCPQWLFIWLTRLSWPRKGLKQNWFFFLLFVISFTYLLLNVIPKIYLFIETNHLKTITLNIKKYVYYFLLVICVLRYKTFIHGKP